MFQLRNLIVEILTLNVSTEQLITIVRYRMMGKLLLFLLSSTGRDNKRWGVHALICLEDGLLKSVFFSNSYILLVILMYIKTSLSVTCDRSMAYSDYSCFLFPRYNWNIVESGIKHHKPNQIKTSWASLRLSSKLHQFKRCNITQTLDHY